MTPVEQITERALKLQELIAVNHPTMPVLLRDIWTQLKADPAVVTLLSEETAHLIVNGLIKQTGVEVAATIMKSKAPGKTIKDIAKDWQNKL